MDDIVRQALAKWPNVPDCYDWLALDARGRWRMRDDATQQQNGPGDVIRHAALNDFISRNYQADARGRWHFQNGPQRVYVQLELTPYIARTDPVHGFMLHTGEALPPASIANVFLTETGQLVLFDGRRVAALDDRDMADGIEALKMDGQAVDDDALLAWMHARENVPGLVWQDGGRQCPVQKIARGALAARFGFVPTPTQ